MANDIVVKRVRETSPGRPLGTPQRVDRTDRARAASKKRAGDREDVAAPIG